MPEVLISHEYAAPWLKMMQHEIEEIKDRDSDINPYGATNEARVSQRGAEYFFSQPESLSKTPRPRHDEPDFPAGTVSMFGGTLWAKNIPFR